LSVRIKDKKTHSTPVQRRLDPLAGEVEKLREQIKKKLQQLEELQRILTLSGAKNCLQKSSG
jgi:hypothetical protein